MDDVETVELYFVGPLQETNCNSAELVPAKHAAKTTTTAPNSNGQDQRVQWLTKGFDFVVSMLMTFCRVLEWKLSLAESKIGELTKLLESRTKQLMKLMEDVDKLRERNKENERRAERQRHELKEQYTALRELYIALRMKKGARMMHINCALPTPTEGENSKQFWLLRKHRKNLTALIKPHIRQVVEESTKAGIVSELVFEYCTETCGDPEEQCDVFYKALQARVGESPNALNLFVELLQQKMKASKPLHSLCNRILAELRVSSV